MINSWSSFAIFTKKSILRTIRKSTINPDVFPVFCDVYDIHIIIIVITILVVLLLMIR